MKKIAVLFLFVYVSVYPQSFYYNAISNSSKTIDYVIGFYHETGSINSNSNGSYTTFKTAIINGKDADPLVCNDNKWFLLLKDGSMVCNYTTAAKDGEYACNYTVYRGDTHIQYVAFHKEIRPRDIVGVWFFTGGQLFGTFKNE